MSLENFNNGLLAIERECYLRPPRDMNLANEIYSWLKNDNPTRTIINLTTEIDYQYFIRSIRKAYETLLNRKIKLTEIETSLVAFNKERKKRPLSKTQYINLLIKKVMKSTLSIQIGTVALDIRPEPSTTHLGNGYIREIGAYDDIWPVLNLITDCDGENNKALGTIFLEFAGSPFEFKKSHLIRINPKFSRPEFLSTVNYFCKYLTGIATLYIFWETSRRLEVIIDEVNNQFYVQNTSKIPFAASVMNILKLLRDEYDVTIEDAFSPNSEYVLFTRAEVKDLPKKIIKPSQNLLSKSGIFRVKEKHKKETLTPTGIKIHLLNPDSEKTPDVDTEKYEGEKVSLKKFNRSDSDD